MKENDMQLSVLNRRTQIVMSGVLVLLAAISGFILLPAEAQARPACPHQCSTTYYPFFNICCERCTYQDCSTSEICNIGHWC